MLSSHSDELCPTPLDFDTEYASAMIGEIAPNVPVRIVRLETLIRMKSNAGRPQDLADIAELNPDDREVDHG